MINHQWSYSLFFSGKLSCNNSTCLLLLCNWGALEISIWIFASNFSWQAVCVKPFPACYTQDLQLISHVSMAGGSIAYRPLTFIMYNKMLHALCQFFFNKMCLNRVQIHARFTAFLACSPSFVFGFCSTCSLQLQKVRRTQALANLDGISSGRGSSFTMQKPFTMAWTPQS